MLITLTTDGSYCHMRQKSGYAFWVSSSGGSYLRYYEHWSKMEEENCKEVLVIIDHMIPMWSKHDNCQYK